MCSFGSYGYLCKFWNFEKLISEQSYIHAYETVLKFISQSEFQNSLIYMHKQSWNFNLRNKNRNLFSDCNGDAQHLPIAMQIYTLNQYVYN